MRMRKGECISCDPGHPVPLFLDTRRGDAVNCCKKCCFQWAAEIMRGVREHAPPANPLPRRANDEG